MTSIVAVGAVTGGINLTISNAQRNALGLEQGSFSILSVTKMDNIYQSLERNLGALPKPSGGGSIANTAELIARAGISSGIIGVAGDDEFGKIYLEKFAAASLTFLSELESGATTGYDFYLTDDDDVRTIILTHGANALLSPERINTQAIKTSKLLLLDGSALTFGPHSEATFSYCIDIAEEKRIPFVLTLASTWVVNEHRAFYETFAPKAQMVAGNLEQAAVLLNLASDSNLKEVKSALAKTTINAIITLDADGVFARFDGEDFFLSTKEVDVVDSTGAGDNFLAAFLVARVKGLPVNKALAVGNIVAGEVVQQVNARLPESINMPEFIQAAIESV